MKMITRKVTLIDYALIKVENGEIITVSKFSVIDKPLGMRDIRQKEEKSGCKVVEVGRTSVTYELDQETFLEHATPRTETDKEN